MSEAALISRDQLFGVGEALGYSPSNTATSLGIPKAISDAVLSGERTLAHGAPDEVAATAFELVCSTDSLCVSHVNIDTLSEQPSYSGVYVGKSIAPLLVNYHNGSSEGYFKLFYQDTVQQTGSWLNLGAFVEGIEGNQTFYNEDVSWAGDPGRYWKTVQNLLKIKHYWYVFGNDKTPAATEAAIQARGFTFKNKTRDVFERIGIEQELESRNIRIWPPKVA